MRTTTSSFLAPPLSLSSVSPPTLVMAKEKLPSTLLVHPAPFQPQTQCDKAAPHITREPCLNDSMDSERMRDRSLQYVVGTCLRLVYKFLQTSAAPLKSAGNEDEAAAMAAMFEAEKANWEETQEKMSQLVSPRRVSCPCSTFSNEYSYLLHHSSRATRIPNANFRGGFNRGGKPYTPHVPSAMDRPLPTSYVCYRCGQKGLSMQLLCTLFSHKLQGHWIKDCPTNDDRAYDNRPRIKRTTGIPRSMLKAVENPTNEQLGQGVMVTPEGGYVVAQPDL